MSDKESYLEYVKSGKYFQNARNWYLKKYITPHVEKSITVIIISFTILLFMGLALNIYYLFPLKLQRRYVSYIKSNSVMSKPVILKANSQNNELDSINEILIKNYVIKKETYNYNNIKNQLLFLQNNSTKLLFKKFYDELSLNNPESKILKFKKKAIRKIFINQIKFLPDNNVIVSFKAYAAINENNILEDSSWEVQISYESDKINTSAPSGSKFNFIVTDYQLKKI